MVSIIVLAGVSETIRFCFLKIFKPKESKISLQTETFHTVLHILKGKDKEKVKELIIVRSNVRMLP